MHGLDKHICGGSSSKSGHSNDNNNDRNTNIH